MTQTSVFRCYKDDGYVDAVAQNGFEAMVDTDADRCDLIHPHPIPSVDEIRQQWKSAKHSRNGLRSIQRWMVAAVRTKMIDVGKFNEMDAAVQDAMERLES